MRVKKLLHGLTVEPGHPFPAIREHTFMDNPNVPDAIKVWTLVVISGVGPS